MRRPNNLHLPFNEEEVTRALNHLCSIPKFAHVTLKTKDLREFLLRTMGGKLMAHGKMWKVVSKSLGAGVYRVSLKSDES